MKLYRTLNGIFVEEEESFYPVNAIGWDELIASVDWRNCGLHDWQRYELAWH